MVKKKYGAPELGLDEVDLGIARNLIGLNPEALSVELLQNHSMPWIETSTCSCPGDFISELSQQPLIRRRSDGRSEIRPPVG